MKRRDALKVLAGSLAGGVLGLPKLPAREDSSRPGPCEVRWFRYETVVPGGTIFYDARDVIPLWKESGDPSEIPGCDPIQYVHFNATRLDHPGYAYYAAVRTGETWRCWNVRPHQLDPDRINMLFIQRFIIHSPHLVLNTYFDEVTPSDDAVWEFRKAMIHEIVTSGKFHTRSRRFPKAHIRWRTNHYSL